MTCDPSRIRCPQCAALVPDVDGQVHGYVPAAPGCWRIFGEVQADEMQRFAYPDAHRLVVDAYMAQHPGDGGDRRDRQSVFCHLCSLYARLEVGMPAVRANEVLRRVVSRQKDFPVLQRDGRPGELTVLHVAGAPDVSIYEARAREWAHVVWQSWRTHHGLVATTVEEVIRA